MHGTNVKIMFFLTYFYCKIFISHFYISYSNVKENSYFKDIANCISKNAFWVAAWRWIYKEAETCRCYDPFIILSITEFMLDWKTYIHFINTHHEDMHKASDPASDTNEQQDSKRRFFHGNVD